MVQRLSQFQFEWTLLERQTRELWKWSELAPLEGVQLLIEEHRDESQSQAAKKRKEVVRSSYYVTTSFKLLFCFIYHLSSRQLKVKFIRSSMFCYGALAHFLWDRRFLVDILWKQTT